jgi:thiamine pyrophosphokinase
MTTDTAVIFSGGDPPGRAAVADLPPDAFVIAADSGLAHALDLGVAVDLVVGDLDSVDPEVLAKAEADGTSVEAHRRDKDQTDGELAMRGAVDRGARSVIIIGGFGGRVDHWLASVGVWSSPAFTGVRVEVRSGPTRIYVVRDELAISGPAGELVSLVAVHGSVTGVRTTGLRFTLHGERIEPGSSRGVSNELTGAEARITVRTGTLLVVRPGELVTGERVP